MRVIIVGAGQVGSELIKRLKRDWALVVIDNDEAKLKRVIEFLDSDALSRCTLIQGDGTSRLILQKAGILEANVFVACTGDDEANLEACRIAKEFSVPAVFAVSNHTDHDVWFEAEGISFINKAVATASLLEKQIVSGVITATNIGLGQGELVEVTVLPTSILVGYPVGKFSSKRWKIAAIYRGNKLILPNKKTVIKPGDKVLIVGDPKVLKHIINLIRSGEPHFPNQFGTEELLFLKDEKYWQRLKKDAEFLAENTKVMKVTLAVCSSDMLSLMSELERKCPGEVVRATTVSECEGGLLKLIQKSEFGLIVLAGNYWEFPLFFGIKPFPITVAEQSLSPVLLSRATAPYKEILVPVSGSFEGYRALEIGIEISLQINANLCAVYVSSGPSDQRHKLIQEKISKFSSLYRLPIRFNVLEGNPISEVAKFSESFDLVILGGRKGRKSNWFSPYPPYHMFFRVKPSAMLVLAGE